MISGDQVKAARELLGWSQGELAKKVRISRVTVGAIERGKSRSSDLALLALKGALEAGGIEFTPWGARLRDEKAGP